MLQVMDGRRDSGIVTAMSSKTLAFVLSCAFATFAIVVACGKSAPADEPAPGESGPPPSQREEAADLPPLEPPPGAGVAAAPRPDTEPAAEVGLADPGNDPRVVGWVREALGCAWTPQGFSIRCPAYQQWLDELKDHQAEPTLVALTADGDEKVRFLGASALVRRGSAYRGDKALSERLVAAAERERSPAVGALLGTLLARIDMAGGLEARVRAIATGHALSDLRAALVGELLFKAGAGWFDLTLELAKGEPDEAVRLAALTAFWVGGQDRREEVCQLWLETIADEAPKVAAKGAYLLSFWGRCQAHFDALQKEQARRAQLGLMTWDYFASVENLARDRRAKRKQKKLAVAIARAVVKQGKNPWAARNRALDYLAAHDRHAKRFIETFTEDEVELVARKASELFDKLR